ncbi:MAG TPA: S9 family peptidase [Acidimicrobiales bacterium]|nr:S9 family peptidase [Acidimicrobiales bacterium]
MPERRRTVLVAHGDERVDDWYWLADRDDPAVVEHLAAENAYTEAATAHLAPLRAALYDEMVARIEETDLSVPARKGPWWYYRRTEEGRDYPIHCRRPATGDDPPLEAAPPGVEEVLLDENLLAEGHDYLDVANLAVSPDHTRLAYAVDRTGAELFDLAFRQLGGPQVTESPEVVTGTYHGVAWAADSRTVFYTRVDEAMRPYQLWRHEVGSDPDGDRLVLEEPDRRFALSVGTTSDEAYVLASLQSTTTSEVWAVRAERPGDDPVVIWGRRAGIEYDVDHLPDGDAGWWLVTTNDGAEDFRLLALPDSGGDAAGAVELIPHRPGTRLDGVQAFAGWLAVSERLDGEHRVRVAPLGPPPGPPSPGLLDGSWLVPSDEHPATTYDGPNPEFDARSLRYEETSLVTPRSVLDVDVDDRRTVLRKRQPVLGGYDPAQYRTFRLWATADDGTAVPISVAHRGDLLADPAAPPRTAPAVPAPCLLYGYGAYEISIDPVFSSLRLSLLDRGFVFAIAHVRGGGELGRRWYEDGRLAKKPHTFGDFVACARHLVGAGFTVPERLVGRGGSAGGLLIGAVANQAPELFCALVAEVPFVDCLTTMLDDSLPLTVGEWEEWGNPAADPEIYAVMKSYSPYDNVTGPADGGPAVTYPRILATAGLHDPRVGYWEPAKWVAKLRHANPDNVAFLRTELGAGHGGPSGRYDAWREEAMTLAFVLDALGLAGEPGS